MTDVSGVVWTRARTSSARSFLEGGFYTFMYRRGWYAADVGRVASAPQPSVLVSFVAPDSAMSESSEGGMCLTAHVVECLTRDASFTWSPLRPSCVRPLMGYQPFRLLAHCVDIKRLCSASLSRLHTPVSACVTEWRSLLRVFSAC